MIDAKQALERLREGNHRFVTGLGGRESLLSLAKRDEHVEGQEPFAVILGCSDSRVPVEFVFDQGMGDLFVIRVAGNIVARSQIGSIEFAAEKFGTRLVVVLGHTRCGAVQATLDHLRQTEEARSHNLLSIVDRIRPAVEKHLRAAPAGDPETLARAAVRANALASVRALRHGSESLERLIRDDGLVIVGAEYALETGEVEFLEEGEE